MIQAKPRTGGQRRRRTEEGAIILALTTLKVRAFRTGMMLTGHALEDACFEAGWEAAVARDPSQKALAARARKEHYRHRILP